MEKKKLIQKSEEIPVTSKKPKKPPVEGLVSDRRESTSKNYKGSFRNGKPIERKS